MLGNINEIKNKHRERKNTYRTWARERERERESSQFFEMKYCLEFKIYIYIYIYARVCMRETGRKQENY